MAHMLTNSFNSLPQIHADSQNIEHERTMCACSVIHLEAQSCLCIAGVELFAGCTIFKTTYLACLNDFKLQRTSL